MTHTADNTDRQEGATVSRLPRWMHRWYANRLGYFWLPCPLCGRMFGGHERPYGSVPDPTRPGYGRVICPQCVGGTTTSSEEQAHG